MTLNNWRKGNLGTENRFKKDNPFYKETISPGPANYNLQEQGSLTVSNSKTALNAAMKSKNVVQFGS
eukprot:CAMPEP_0168346282 /NCGR_PEP_ID=MMETSP0213-20121227/18156_1 /TAXON_ID=151035 /ORGANISM="Euplotes harpa, Strain FSP1.4" /LENGTH=66 /DNA_ID=CAMNT_0008354859 /DNA_START=10 /DNA_END=207 /DNA_ORIENTATION=-